MALTGRLIGDELTPAGLVQAAATRTPLLPVDIGFRGRSRRVLVKLEMGNPTESVKYRTALGLLAALHTEQPLARGSAIVESTSGNLGVALGHLAAQAGWHFQAVVDPKVPRPLLTRMRDLGVELLLVDVPDEHGSYLLTRLAAVRDLRQRRPELRWTDQYHSPAGSAIHRDVTAAELMEQTGGRFDALFCAVSTGGTLSGISAGLRRLGSTAAIYAVDVEGSLAVGGRPRPHLLNGIGAPRRSTLLDSSDYRRAFHVSDIQALALCRLFARRTGLALGSSSGAVLGGYLAAEAAGEPMSRPVLISADGGENYRGTVYDDGWLAERGVLAAVQAAEESAGAEGLTISSPEVSDDH
ncbi:pyridoxal-phosphate dependent enzyme [Dactylosporangium sp. NPDC051484]|uniref:pyridoxal-phosphate dependent enzyme n=1 Tax=Dactylosporangium sp. NPDC051484 TaxID=3154942 RepID=UPI00344D9D66